jgi:micrococcal nuclease
VAAALTKGDEFGPTAPIGPLTACTLTRIIDGDTVSCDPVGDVRLIGIDAPERNQPTPYERSTAALTAFVPIGETIELESDVEARDRYGRRLAHLWYKGRLVNWLMVRNGWAASYYYAPSIRYAAPLDSAESWARAERRGMWPDGGLPCRADPRRGKRC